MIPISKSQLREAASQNGVLRPVQTGVTVGPLASLGLGADVFAAVVVRKIAPRGALLPGLTSRVTSTAAVFRVAGAGAESIRLSSTISEARRGTPLRNHMIS